MTDAGHRGVFSRDGEFWRIGFDNDSFALKHSKGLSYLAQLLRFPGREFHALDLISGVADDSDDISVSMRSSLQHGDDALASAGIHVGGPGDAGEMLDEQAKAQYRRRIDELREELAEAKSLGQVDRAERAEAEIDALTSELSRAVGLGGRNRRAASSSERARQSVTHAIKLAIEKVGENHSPLAAILSRRVKTGIFCAYNPDLEIRLDWEFERGAIGSPSYQIKSAPPDALGLDALRPPDTAGGRSRTELVGREVELAQLWSAAERTLAGHGAMILLGGGPGVGKTRLSLEVLGRGSEHGFATLSGRCYERDDPHPLMPFVEIIETTLSEASSVEQFRALAAEEAGALTRIAPGLRRVFPNVAAPPELPTPQVRRYLFQSLFDFIARLSRARPLILLLDDIHWADDSTLAMITFLARRVEHVPVLVLATYRDEELDATRPLNRTLEELLRLGIQPVKLRGLAREGVAQMVGDLSRREPPDHLVTLIFEETQGNPFFVEEVFSHLVEEGRIFDEAGNFQQPSGSDDLTVPENIRLVLSRRLDRLSEDAREVLSSASVIGRSFSFMLLETVANRLDSDALFDGLEEVQRTGFITSSSEGAEAPFAFSHELVRQTLLAGISQPRQQRLHFKIAQALEKIYATRLEERAAEIAYHLFRSGPHVDHAKVAHYLLFLGQSLLRAGALEDARLTLTKALEYQQPDAGKRAQTLANLATAERGLGAWSEAIAHLQESLGLYAVARDLRSIGRVVFEMVEGFIWTGHFDEAAEITEKGLSHLRFDEGAYRARLLAAWGFIHALRGQFSAAITAFDEALASPAVTPFLARLLAYRAACHSHFLRLDQALEDSRKSTALSSPQDSPWTHSAALTHTMVSLYHLGHANQARKIAIELEPLARGVGHLAALSYSVSIRAWAEFGREPDLLLLARRISDNVAANRGARVALFLSLSLAEMSRVRFLSGDWDSARAMAEEAAATEPRGVFRGVSVAMLLRLAAYAADRNRVLELAEQTQSQLPVAGRANTVGAFTLLMSTVESLTMIGERERAANLYPLVRELLGTKIVCLSYTCRFPETVAGIAAGAAGNWDAAEQHFATALKLAHELPHRLEEAEVSRFHAMTLLKRNPASDRERARKMLERAARSYGLIGMPRHLELIRGLEKAAQ